MKRAKETFILLGQVVGVALSVFLLVLLFLLPESGKDQLRLPREEMFPLLLAQDLKPSLRRVLLEWEECWKLLA